MAIINRDVGIDKAGGNVDLARELFSILQDELRKALVDLQCAEFLDADARKLAHKLRSSARYCAAPNLEQTAEDCELAPHDENLVEHRNRLATAIQDVLNLPLPY